MQSPFALFCCFFEQGIIQERQKKAQFYSHFFSFLFFQYKYFFQVENEYGAFHACDKDYLTWLRDETEMYVQGKAILFTTDIPNQKMECGKIEGVFATTDFGVDGSE